MQREHVASAVAGKRDLPRAARLGQQQLHASDHALKRTLALEPDGERRVFPQHHVVLEKHWHAAVEPDMQYRHQLSVDAVVHTRRAPVGNGGRQQLWWLCSVGLRSLPRRFLDSRLPGVAGEKAKGGDRSDRRR